MLSTLLSSKNRAKILAFFLTHPGERFYYSELVKRLKITSSAIQNELARFRKVGLLETKREANIRYYWINKNFPLYPELKNIVLKTSGLADELKKELSNIGEIKFAFIYGSVAKNTEDIKSDIDLMIIGNPNLDTLTQIVSKAEENLSREINYTIFEVQEWKQRIKKKDSFVTNVVKNPKIFLIGDESGLRRIA